MSEEKWFILTVEHPTQGKCICTIRKDARSAAQDLVTLVTVTWEYQEMDDQQFPTGTERDFMHEFDDWMGHLDDSDGSTVKVMQVTGLGSREWSFHTTNFEHWIDQFNKIMADKPRVPIDISYSNDPDMEYWQSYAVHLEGHSN